MLEKQECVIPQIGKLNKKSISYKRENGMSNRYPDFGPLNIENQQEYLLFSKQFFCAHFMKPVSLMAKKEDFEISHVLGHGTFGYVVLAKHLTSNIEYSIKIIPKKKLIELKQVRQSFQEKNVLQALNSPFTIYLVYFFMDNSYLYFVQPYISGGELYQHLVKLGKFQEPQAQFYISQVVLGLEYLHHLNLIYRDLKPENILIDYTGYLKLIDFGFSKKLNTGRTYTLCGTPEYMAPEIILNVGHGLPADWWAAGVLVYELVSGETPFYHRDKMRIYEKIVTNSYRMSDGFSKDLKDLISHFLQFNPTQRYGNLKGGVDDIKRHKWLKTINWLAILNRKITPPIIPDANPISKTENKPIMSLKIDNVDKYSDAFKIFND